VIEKIEIVLGENFYWQQQSPRQQKVITEREVEFAEKISMEVRSSLNRECSCQLHECRTPGEAIDNNKRDLGGPSS